MADFHLRRVGLYFLRLTINNQQAELFFMINDGICKRPQTVPYRDLVRDAAVLSEVADELGITAAVDPEVASADTAPLVPVVAVATGAGAVQIVNAVADPIVWVAAVVATTAHRYKVDQRCRR